jgi:hypothetical protein
MISDRTTTEFLIDYISTHNPEAAIICMGETPKQATELYERGASYVMLPNYIGSEKISSFVKRSKLSKNEFDRYRTKHLEHLKNHSGIADSLDDAQAHNLKLGHIIVENVAALTKIKHPKPKN